MVAESLARMLQEFLAEARSAAVFEGGEELFVFAENADSARYNISGDDTKCLLHLWSAERNLVRRVLELETKKDSLVLTIQRFGQSKPAKLEILRDRDRRAPVARKQARLAYAKNLERSLARTFPDLAVSRFTSAMDLERSFGPAYARGTLRRGRSQFAVLGVNGDETQATIDGALTFALLWLDHLRQNAETEVVEGLKLIVPRGTSGTVRERMACLNHAAAKFELYELNEREQEISSIDCADRGNMQTHLVRAVDETRVRERFSGAITTVLALTPHPARVEVIAASPAEIGFRLHGLQFARARMEAAPTASSGGAAITFGAGANEIPFTDENKSTILRLLQVLFSARCANGERNHPLWRMQPERWLESLITKEIAVVDSALDPANVYSQVPAFSSSDRGVIDVLAATREGRLTVIELKVDEDIHLPLQGLDYWARVAWHHGRGEFQPNGYFSARELSQLLPRLLLVAPALHIHPTTDVLLRYLSPQIEWQLIALDERWRGTDNRHEENLAGDGRARREHAGARSGLRVAFRKSSVHAAASA